MRPAFLALVIATAITGNGTRLGRIRKLQTHEAGIACEAVAMHHCGPSVDMFR